MKPKKSSKVIIIAIIILLILIIGIGVAYAYLTTDLLKSNKKLFFNYLTQIGDTTEETGFIETNLTKYFEKKKNTPYTNNGKFYVDIIIPEEYMPSIQPTNNMDITFNGEVDSSTSKAMQNVSINYSNDVKFEFIYKQIGSMYGLQNDYVSKKYIALDTENEADSSTSELQESIAKIENVTNPQIDTEEAKQILEKYANILDQELQDSNFSKVQENNETGYKLALSGEQFKNIIIKILETAKNDQKLLEKINQQTSEKYTANNIEDMIEKLNDDTELNDKTIETTIYQNERKTTKIAIIIDTLKMEIAKNNVSGELQYNISLEQQEKEEQTAFKAYLNIKFAGLATMQNISESYEVGIEFPIEDKKSSYTYYFNNDVVFGQTSNIETFTDSNCVDLTSLEEEQASKFTTSIAERLQLVNKKQMEELGLDENANPLINMLPTLLFYGMGTSNVEMDQMSQTEIATFNSQYELYEGTNLKGTTVKGLLTTIAKNNKIDGESEENGASVTGATDENDRRLIEEINFNGEEYEVNLQNLTIIRGEIGTEDYYRVEFEKNDDGAIYRAVINKK